VTKVNLFWRTFVHSWVSQVRVTCDQISSYHFVVTSYCEQFFLLGVVLQ
jgi:hypothetical protein